MPSVVCPKCGADVLLPGRPVAKTCCLKCKTVFPVRPTAPPIPKQSPGAEVRAQPPKGQPVEVPEDRRGSDAPGGRYLWLAALVPVLALGGFGLGWWINRKPEPAPIAAVAPEEVKPEVNEAPVAAAQNQGAVAKAEAEKLARERADREAKARQAEREAKARADREKERQERIQRANAEEERVRDLWRRHRKNWVRVDQKFYRAPDDITPHLINQAGGVSDRVFLRVGVGEFGVPGTYRVNQVLGERDALVTCESLAGHRDVSMRFSRIKTFGLTDGGRYSTDATFVIIGTWKYTTVLRADRTVFLAVPVSAFQDGLELADFRELLTQTHNLGPDRESQQRKADVERPQKEKQLAAKHIGAELENIRKQKEKCQDAIKSYQKQIRIGLMTSKQAAILTKRERAELDKLEARERELLKQLPQEPKPPKPEPKPVNPEEDGALKLKLAKAMLRDADDAKAKGDTAQVLSLKDKARTRLKEIIDKYPDTAAGKEAKELLEKLNG